MTSLSDQAYFPPLQDCLQGSKFLLPWKLVAETLCDVSTDRLASAAVSSFLQDPLVLAYLKSPLQPFEPASARSKSDFDTKTAAINVVPTPNDKYDIKTIREDAQWLSGAVKINEVAALRIVVVEFQARALAHLAGPLSSQDVANLQEALGGDNAQAAAVLAPLAASTWPDAEALWADFQTESSRRRRLLATCLSERRHFMASADQLLTFLLHESPSRSGPPVDALRKSLLRDAFGFDLDKDFNIVAFEALVPKYLRVLPSCLDRCQSGLESVDASILTEELEVDLIGSCLFETVHAMTLVFQILDLSGQIFANPDAVTQWFRIMNECAFMDGLNAVPEGISELVVPIRCLVCVISIAFLNPRRSLAYLDQEIELHDYESPYLRSVTDLEEVHAIITAAADRFSVAASPVYLCWSLILHRMHVAYQERVERRDIAQNQRAQDGFELEHRPTAVARRNSAGSIISIEQLPYDSFLTTATHERDMQVVETLARTATASGLVFDWMAEMALCMGDGGQEAAFRPVVASRMRLVLLDVLRVSFPVVGYLPESVSALLSVLAGGRQYWDLGSDMSVLPTQDVVVLARADADVRAFYLSQALHRFPYEFIPFASLCRILSTYPSTDEHSNPLLALLFSAPTLTFVLPSSFDQYELAQEEDNTNTMRLTEEIPLFAPSRLKRRFAADEPFCIPKGTYGRFVTDTGRVVMLDYEYSPLALLSKRLECSLAPDAHVLQLGPLQPHETCEAISLLAVLVRSEAVQSITRKPSSTCETALSILEEASRFLAGTRDIISVVCDMLDSLLSQDLVNSDGAEISTLTACVEFLHAVLPVCPGRVWSYMARCELLNTDSKAGRLSAVVGTLDMDGDRFSCLTASVRLFASLIDSTVSSAVQRRVGTNFGNRHQRGPANPWLGTSDKVLARVSLSIAQSTVDMFEYSTTWRFSSEVQRSSALRDIVGLLNSVMSNAFSLEAPGASDSLTACLVPAGKYLVETFLASSGSLKFQPLLASLLAAAYLPNSTLYPARTELIFSRFRMVVVYATTLLRAAEYLRQSSAGLQSQLFRSACLLAKVCAEKTALRASAYDLLSILIASATKESNEPPSLLGYLGPQTSRSFLQVLSGLDRPYDRAGEEIRAWKFCSAILRNRQQWMANCILTGKTPREALKGVAKPAVASSDSVFSMAVERLQSISSLDKHVSVAILEFITSAQNYWPWTVFATRTDQSFWESLRAYARGLKTSPPAAARAGTDVFALDVRIAAYIAEAFAMRLYHLRQTGDEGNFAEDISKDVDFYLREGVQVSGYNVSLHVNLARNFAARYPGCTVDDFRRTPVAGDGEDSGRVYSTGVAAKMLSFDPAWFGKKRDDGFWTEMGLANRNLFLVEAEVALLHAWEYLLLELSAHLLPTSQAMATHMLQVAELCLAANADSQGPDAIFADVNQSRSAMAQNLLQRLAETSQLPKDSSRLLKTVWIAVRSIDEPFGEGQVQYYRSLLKILYLVLRGNRHSDKMEGEVGATPTPDSIVTTTQTILEIIDRVVASGFRTLVGIIHDAPTATSAEDLALLTAILQACLCLPGLDQCQGQILNILASHDVLTVASSLYSWADKLTDRGDPVYGELSLLFLLELSSLPLIAEHMACEGFLGQLSSANLSALLRRPNVSPVADSALATRCYGIWAKAILPLLLNMLTALGATIAPEVAFVLNQFPNLLQASTDRLEAPGLSRTAPSSSSASASTATATAAAGAANGGGGGGGDARHYVTLLAVSEVHSLALLTRGLASLRQGSTAVRDLAAVHWDAAALLEHVDFWLASRRVLRERLLPLGRRELEWRNAPAVRAGCDMSRLEEKVVAQLEAVRDVLSVGSG